MPRAIKKPAKIFLSTPLEMLFAKIAPPTLNIKPETGKSQVSLNATNLCFMWIIIATMLIGKKAIKFMPCAVICLNFKNIVKMGIVSVPPPMPMPATMPPITPAKMLQIIIPPT